MSLADHKSFVSHGLAARHGLAPGLLYLAPEVYVKKLLSPTVALTLAVSCGLLAIMPTQALAIPSFARKYRTSCSTCHIAYPVLNSFGKAFKARGYRLPMEETLTKDEPVSLGAPAWKKVFPESLWPADMPGGSVVAFWLSSR